MKIALTDKIVLVTGGSRGIGRAAAELFAEAGATVAINYKSDNQAAEYAVQACQAKGARAAAYAADIADKAAVDSMVELILADFGHIDILVNNAGIWMENPVASMTDQSLQETININVLGTFYPIMAVVNTMIDQKAGCIINIASTAICRFQRRGHCPDQVAGPRIGPPQYPRQLRRPRLGRNRHEPPGAARGRGAESLCGHPAGSGRAARRTRRSDRLPGLGSRHFYHRGNPECQRGSRPLRLIFCCPANRPAVRIRIVSAVAPKRHRFGRLLLYCRKPVAHVCFAYG